LCKDIEILIYGNDPKEASFPYRFLGWLTLPKLSQYYSEAHILFCSSWYESFPLPPIEAMACGCVAVASRYGTEDYLIDQQSGIVINPFDIEGTVDKIVNLINHPDLMYQLALKGVEASRQFRWEAQIDKLNEFLLKLPEPQLLNIPAIQNGNLGELDKIYA
jgi:glycosyltransferase involved in cell wall biosynthesis